MLTELTVRSALEVVAVGILLGLGWVAISAVWAWLTTGGQPPAAAIIGGVVVVVTFLLLVLL